jgi:ATP-dependent Clp protease protease subunit
MAKKTKIIPSEYIYSRLQSVAGSGVDVDGRRIYLMDEINRESAYHFIASFHILDDYSGPIWTVLNSRGGSMEDGLAIYDCIKSSRSETIVLGTGSVMSAAAIIMQAGDLRLLTENATFMIHDIILEFNEASIKSNDLTQLGREVNKNNEILHNILSSKSGKTLNEITKLCKTDSFFTAAEAIKSGFADEIFSLREVKNGK